MTAVSSPPQDTIVSQPTREVTYFAKREDLRLVHTPEYPILAANGMKTGMTNDSVRIEFRGGMLRVPLEGTVTTAQGRQFPAAELIAWLDRHPLLGDVHEGFNKLPQVAPPASEAELTAINDAAMHHQEDRLQAILDAERAGWGRKEVVGLVERALETVAEIRAQYEAMIAEQVAEPEAESKPPAKKPAPKAAK